MLPLVLAWSMFADSFQRKRERLKLWFFKLQRVVATEHSVYVRLNVRHVIVNGLIKFVPLFPIIEMLLYLPDVRIRGQATFPLALVTTGPGVFGSSPRYRARAHAAPFIRRRGCCVLPPDLPFGPICGLPRPIVFLLYTAGGESAKDILIGL